MDDKHREGAYNDGARPMAYNSSAHDGAANVQMTTVKKSGHDVRLVTTGVSGAKPKQRDLVDGAWFQLKLKAKGKTQAEFARFAGVGTSQVSKMLSGVRSMTLAEARLWSEFLSEPISEIYVHAGVEPPADYGEDPVELVGWVDGDGRVHMDTEPIKGRKLVPRPPGAGADCHALRVLAHGPMNGWTVYVAPGGQDVEREAIGKLSVVCTWPANELYLRVLEADVNHHGMWVLHPLLRGQGMGLDNVRVRWASPVVWVRC